MTDTIPDSELALKLGKEGGDSSKDTGSALVIVLASSHEEFEYLLMDPTIVQSIVAVLHGHLDGHPMQADLAKTVLAIFDRALSLRVDSPLLSMESLCQFILIYGRHDPPRIRSMLKHCDLSPSFAALAKTLQSMPNPFPMARESLERAHVTTRLLSSLTMVCQVNEPTLGSSLFTSYEAFNQAPFPQDRSQQKYIYTIKREIVSALNDLVEQRFFRPLGFMTDPQDPRVLIQHGTADDIDHVVSELLACCMDWFENSGLESRKSTFIDAPLVMDWELEYNTSGKMQLINDTLLKGENEQLQYLQMSLEQIRDMNQGENIWRETVSTKLVAGTDQDETLVLAISKVQELFPDLGEGFIEACLVESNHSAELVIEQLLEDNLPPSVASLDRSMKRRTEHENDPARPAAPSQTIPRRARRPKALVNTSDMKQDILQRVYNMYEDEYDDTYDGINDAAVPAGADAVDEDNASELVKPQTNTMVDPSIAHESTLVKAFVDTPSVFDRTSSIRKSKPRADMRKRTGMSDEQLEGWAIMFKRNPRQQRVLDKYMLAIEQPSATPPPQPLPSSPSSSAKDVSSTTPPTNTKREQNYKQKNKGRIANHQRKKMHSKKTGASFGSS